MASPSQQTAPFTGAMKKEMQAKVVEACRHAWNGYRQYAWGYDDLQPLTKNGKNWHAQSMLMTPVDAHDTFILLGMKKEAAEAKALILQKLHFNHNQEVQVFEIVIRLLGGLITAYEMDGDKRFLALAEDLGRRLMPAFASPTGMPYRYVHLQTGAVRDSVNNPAEIGTLLLELGKLSQLTGNKTYYAAARKAIMELFSRRSEIGLVGLQIDVTTGKWVRETASIGAMIDSYYEYLYKGWKLFGDEELLSAWKLHKQAIATHLYRKTWNGLYLAHVNMHSGKELATTYGALDAFYAGLLAYAGDTAAARQNQMANFNMWTRFGVEPEYFDFTTWKVRNGSYILRPENLESAFYLYRATKDPQYLWMGKQMMEDIIRHCRTDVAFASVRDVATMEKSNSMQSFFFAETLKYAWLLFAPPSALDLDRFVFNTEAHPFRVRRK